MALKVRDFFVNYFTLSGELLPQDEAEASIRSGVSFKGTNIVILILAILIASLGLNTNSTAVIIGAMLISPLMGPIIGIGLGIGIHDFELIKRSLRNLIMAALFSLIASTIYFLISPVNEQHSELLARTSPTIYDVLIGFVGGGAGILAICSKNKGNVIPGVAIATALMPPLCTAGYGLATWQLNYLFGAFYLFLINSIYIAFATFIGVKLMKFKPVPVANAVRAKKVMRVVYTLAIIAMLPAIWLTINMLRQNRLEVNIDRFVNNECKFPDTQVLTRKLITSKGERYLQLTLIGRVLPADSLCNALDSRLGYYGINNTKVIVVQGQAVTVSQANEEATARDIYQILSSEVARRDATVDSLRNIIRGYEASWGSAVAIAPEVKILFPEVTELAMTRAVFGDIAKAAAEDSLGAPSDTVNIALVSLNKQMTSSQRNQFSEYLKARLNLNNLRIVEIPLSVATKK